MTTVRTRRVLSARELVTIRAALRLWVETPPEWIPERCYEEVDQAIIASPVEIEQLLVEFAHEEGMPPA